MIRNLYKELINYDEIINCYRVLKNFIWDKNTDIDIRNSNRIYINDYIPYFGHILLLNTYDKLVYMAFNIEHKQLFKIDKVNDWHIYGLKFKDYSCFESDLKNINYKEIKIYT